MSPFGSSKRRSLNNPTSRKMSNSAIERFLKQQALIDRLLPPDLSTSFFLGDIQQPSYAKTLTQALKEINRQASLFEATQSLFVSSAMLDQMEALTKPAANFQGILDRAVMPDLRVLAALAERMSKQVELFTTANIAGTAWSQLLEKQMAAVQVPWLDPDLPALSLEGFAVISRLGQAVRYAEPFDEAARDQIDEDLGDPIDVEGDAGPDQRDAAHLEADMNPALLTIPSAAVGDVLIQSGFVFKSKFAPLPRTTDESNPGHIFHPGHHMLIAAVEQNLRATIAKRMQAQYGESWMGKQISPNVLHKCIERRQKAVASGESPLHFLQYSDFMDLKDIVVNRRHWRDVFEAIFRNKEHFQTSMERLHPIRLPLAHSRPIGIAQQFHLISEAVHILCALGVDIFEEG